MKTLLVILLVFTLCAPALAGKGGMVIQIDPNKGLDSTKTYVYDTDSRGDTWVLDTKTGKTWYDIGDKPRPGHQPDLSIIGGDDGDDD